MIDRLEILVSRLRRIVSRNRWTARLLGTDPVIGHADEPGLVLIQLDGVGEEVFRRALAEGRLPFLKQLLDQDGYAARTMYSGMASNTPCFQAELFYGVKGAVPGFGFLDPELDRPAVMSQPAAAALIEKRLRAAGHRGLLEGGSAWSNIFAGGAAESHFCASTAGLNQLLRALQPSRLIGLVLWHGWSVVRVAANLVAETALALHDFVRGTVAGRDLRMELRFVLERVLVSAVLREIVTAGACADADRGLPIVHMNLLGYDEHAHRRGPDSRFALWTLRGLDRSVKRVWQAAARSHHRDYQVWVYADHGQEPVEAYKRVHGEDVTNAIRRVWDGAAPARREEPEDRSARARTVARELPEWVLRGGPEAEPLPPEPVPEGEPTVLHKGPIGFVYLPEGTTLARRDDFAARVAAHAHVPAVLARDGDAGVHVWTARAGRLHLPGDEIEFLGEGHPHADRIVEDLLRIAHHENSGDLMLLSWDRERPLSFKVENGAHGGPGPRETTAWVVMPPEAAARLPVGRTLRPLDVRALARVLLDREAAHLPSPVDVPDPPPGASRLRVLTYNVHGCRGMDGRYSVERISRVIAREQPDVVCLQELDHTRPRSGGVDQAREIARRLEAESHFHSVRDLDDGDFGDAILTALPARLVRSGPLPAVRLPLEERGVVWIEVEVGGQRLQVLNTHLSILERERRLQADALLAEWIAPARARGPVILAGDFNATSESSVGRRLTRKLRDTARLARQDGLRGSGPRTWSAACRCCGSITST